MKKFIALMLISFIFVGCGYRVTSDKDVEIASLKKEIKKLKDEKSDNIGSDVSEITTDIIMETTTEEPKKQDIQSKVSVSVTDKINKPEDIYAGRYRPFIELKVSATNNTNCGIRGVQGILYVDDLFGENILSINWDLTGEMIYSGKTVNYSDYGLEVNQFMDKHMKFYNTNYSDLKFRYEIKQIVYSDDTVEKAD